jgi:hypothetical protein
VTSAAACPGWVDGDRVTATELHDSGSDLLHPPADLVPEREGRRLVPPIAAFARDDGEVGVAKARAGHPDDDLARSRMRLWHILKFRLCLRLGESVRLHHVRDCTTRAKTGLLHDGIGDTLVGVANASAWAAGRGAPTS